jgi:hypothetical protein
MSIASSPPPPPPPAPVIWAGRFKLLGEVGRGNLAVVVRAEEVGSGRLVALKVLHDNLRQNADLVARFRREVDVTAQVVHANVVRVEEVVETDDHIFLVMPFVAGGDLQRLIEDCGPLSEPDLLRLAHQMCSALATAHAAGVIHRDIKPQNILVEVCDEGLRFALTDFGLARSMEAHGLTTALSVLGTPAYMAPEVVLDGHADQRSDLYSLGAVLYEGATGRPAFSGESPYSLFHQQVSVAIKPPRACGAAISCTTESVILRALEKDPLDRWSDAAAMSSALSSKDFTSEDPARAIAKAQLEPSVCPSCAGSWLKQVGVCPACGHQALGAGPPGSLTLMLVNPGAAGVRLNSEQQLRLGRVLKQIALPELVQRVPKLARWPVVVADKLDQHDADVAARAFREAGFEVAVSSRRSSLTKEGWTLVKKEGLKVGLPAMMLLTQALRLLPRGWFIEGVSLMFLTPLLAGGVFGALSLRPQVKRGRVLPRAHLLSLGRQLAGLRRVQERHSAARILQICAWLSQADHDDLSQLVAGRAEAMTKVLLALDEADLALSQSPSDATEALRALREGERLRLVAAADLLNLLRASEDAMARLLVADDRSSGHSQLLQDLQRDLEQTRLNLKAKAEVEALLEPR